MCAAQKAEHYEITSYGSLCAFAEQLGMDSACDRIEEILDQEKAADAKLSQLAESSLNLEADSGSDEEEEEEEEHSTCRCHPEGARHGVGPSTYGDPRSFI